MTITAGYATLADFKAYARITSTDSTDDGVIESIIEGASRYIDGKTGRTFYTRSETRYMDTPDGRELWLDDDLISISTLTNGNATVLTTSDYVLLPNNASPKYSIKLRDASSASWELSSTDNSPEKAITIVGSWGYAATAPDDVALACLMISEAAYKRRFGENMSGTATITAAGVVIAPQDIPAGARELLRPYIRTAP